jgi:hypothetical protein
MLEELILQSVVYGAQNDEDVYVFVRQFTDLPFENVREKTIELLGPIPLEAKLAPVGYRLN